jgi:hypothetical protein
MKTETYESKEKNNEHKNSVTLSQDRTKSPERLPLVGEVSANFF